MPSSSLLHRIKLQDSWKTALEEEFEQDYFEHLVTFLKVEKANGKTIYPPGNEIFAAFNAIEFNKVKVVIIGQDPYHGPGQANGLCFSVHDGISHPPSLINIFKEIQSDLGRSYPKSGDLSAWAKQGVLLLNSILTVESNQAGSHRKKGWERFTDSVIQKLADERKELVFMLWGGYAKTKGNMIDANYHKVLKSGHPSPLSANRGYWFGNKHFSQANDYLSSKGVEPINWNLE